MLASGTEIGSYVIDSVVASGAMGVVYKGHHKFLDHEAAIKVLLPNLAMNTTLRTRFVQEARVQSQLQAPGIIGIWDFVIQEDILAIVMEYVDGPTLEHVMEQLKAPWPADDAKRVMAPIVAAAAHAHALGVIHRDLKPVNVIMDLSAGARWPGEPKVTDFGLAKLLAGESGLTMVGSRMGTLPYMSPEQYSGKKEIGAQTDVFALGMMYWRLLTGDLPINPEDHVAASRLYTGEDPIPPLEEVAPDTPENLRAAVSAALSVDPQDRPADAGELAKLLGMQLLLPKPGQSKPAMPPRHQHSDPGKILTPSMGGNETQEAPPMGEPLPESDSDAQHDDLYSSDEPYSDDDPLPEKKKSRWLLWVGVILLTLVLICGGGGLLLSAGALTGGVVFLRQLSGLDIGADLVEAEQGPAAMDPAATEPAAEEPAPNGEVGTASPAQGAGQPEPEKEEPASEPAAEEQPAIEDPIQEPGAEQPPTSEERPAEKTAETPAAAPSSGVSLTVEGASSVTLIQGAQRYGLPGSVPLGRYDVEVSFSGEAASAAGQVTIREGNSTLRCSEKMGLCRVR